MGNSASKARQAAGSTARKYPSRSTAPPTAAGRPRPPPPPPPPAPSPSKPGPSVHPKVHASSNRDETINLDSSDPDFARSLRSLGAVQPQDQQNPSTMYTAVLSSRGAAAAPNPALRVLEAREQWAALAEKEAGEVGRRGFAGRELLDVGTLRRVLVMRERGWSEERIEKEFDLKRGSVARLGGKDVIGVTQMGVD